jgi:hypothetical protein
MTRQHGSTKASAGIRLESKRKVKHSRSDAAGDRRFLAYVGEPLSGAARARGHERPEVGRERLAL